MIEKNQKDCDIKQFHNIDSLLSVYIKDNSKMKTVCYIIPKSAERSYTCTHRLNYYLHGELKVRTSCLVLFPISVQFYYLFYIFQNMDSSFVPKLLTVVGGV